VVIFHGFNHYCSCLQSKSNTASTDISKRIPITAQSLH
jgi:hypothetical protein